MSSQKLAPFGDRGLFHRFECGAVADVAVWIEVIVERCVGRGEFLSVRHSPEPRHCPLSSSEVQVAVLGSVVEVTSDLLAVFISDLFHCCAI